MESANLHHLQDQLLGSSSLPNPTFYGVGANHAWTQNITLNTGTFHQNSNEVFSNSRGDSRQNHNDVLVPPLNSSMVQDYGFHCTSTARSFTSQSAHDLHLAKIKEELSADQSFPKFTEMLNSCSTGIEDFHLPSPSDIKNEQKDLNIDFSERLLLKTISPKGIFYSNAQNSPGFGGVAMPSRGNFSQIYPSINVSSLNQSSSTISSSLDMNLQALDLLTSARFSGNLSQPSHDSLGIFKDSFPFAPEHMQQLTHRQSCSPRNISPFTTRITEVKRPNSLMEPKASQATTPKKSRLESRASCPPFKVRKEKLGDRIAALQQLVAPFGKTDTASVLMEAIGYIKFLQNQVETLSVPYMKSSRNKTCRTMQGGSMDDGNEEPKRDLQSRGLCLVPLSCMSYVTGDSGGGGVWPQPNFGGGGN